MENLNKEQIKTELFSTIWRSVETIEKETGLDFEDYEGIIQDNLKNESVEVKEWFADCLHEDAYGKNAGAFKRLTYANLEFKGQHFTACFAIDYVSEYDYFAIEDDFPISLNYLINKDEIEQEKNKMLELLLGVDQEQLYATLHRLALPNMVNQ